MNDPACAAVTVAVINYNGAETLVPTLAAVLQQQPAVAAVLLIDNASTDDSVARVQESFGAQVRVVPMPENRGPNPARNAAVRESRTPLVLMMDNDILLAPDYVSRLATVFAQQPRAGAASGQIRLHAQPEVVQYNGAFIHYAGEVVANHSALATPVEVGVVPTGALMVRRAAAEAVGGLDEDLIFGWADGDFTFRLTLADTPCYVLSPAVCYHMQRPRGMKWVRYQVRNRWWFIGKYYDRRTFLLALPGILLYQVCAGLFYTAKGQGRAFLQGTGEALRSWPAIRVKRRAAQALKRRRDRDCLSGGPIELPGAVRQQRALVLAGRLVSALLSGYWRLIRPLLR